MAISLVGTPRSGSAIDGNSVALTFDVPPIEGDVCFTFSAHFTRAGMPALPSTPGYTTLYDNATASSIHTACAYKVFDSFPDFTVEFQGTLTTSDACAAVAIVLRGVHASVIGATPVFQAAGGSVPNPPSITTANANSWVIAFGSALNLDATIGTITGYTNHAQAAGNDTQAITVAVATKATTTTGVQDPAAWSTWSVGSWKCGTIEVREAAAGGTTTPVDADSDGLATVIGNGVAVVTDAVTSVGLAVVNAVSGAVKSSVSNSNGLAVVNVVGGVAATIVQRDFSSSGVAVVGAIGGSAQGGIFNSSGIAIVSAVSGVTARSVYGSNGVATVFGNGADADVAPTASFPYVVTLRRRRRGHVNA